MGLWFPNLRMLSGSSIGLPLAPYVCPYSRVTVMPYATWTTFILSRFFFFFEVTTFIWKSLDSFGFQNLLCIANARGCRQRCIREKDRKRQRDAKTLLRYKMSSGALLLNINKKEKVYLISIYPNISNDLVWRVHPLKTSRENNIHTGDSNRQPRHCKECRRAHLQEIQVSVPGV